MNSDSDVDAKYEAENQEILRKVKADFVDVVRVNGEVAQISVRYPGGEMDVPFLNFPSFPITGEIDVSTAKRSSETPSAETPATPKN